MRLTVVRSLRLLAGAAVLLGAATACSAGGTVSSGASCAALLTFRGQVYQAITLRTHPPYDRVGRVPAAHRHEIGTGVRPPCQDTNRPDDATPAQAVGVARIDGVDPGVAVAMLPYGTVFVRSGATAPATLTSASWIQWISPSQ